MLIHAQALHNAELAEPGQEQVWIAVASCHGANVSSRFSSSATRACAR
jgi:hypothetical protein